ncbi:hypothetical protein Q7C36_010077 [Tachysurus vachellii]|uniref:Uncharacterized protein n=1 Tax=Tachysurus vachellii TaxID=175792 RepID=A0AA88N3Q6_TACVA|nr:hypothetical protein Q7C36_010077 [Tachysurus vachellii]
MEECPDMMSTAEIAQIKNRPDPSSTVTHGGDIRVPPNTQCKKHTGIQLWFCNYHCRTLAGISDQI